MSICRRIITGELSSPVSRHVPATKLPARSPVHYVNFNHRPAIISRSTTTKCYVIEAVESAVVLRRGVGGGGNGKWRRWCAVGDQVVEINDSRKSRDQTAEIMVAATATVVLGVGNRVLYKLALVPLKNYPFFLAQLATFGYVLVYFTILYLRYHAGKVTDEMLSLPKTPFVAVGLLEALAAASGMAAGAILSGATIPILSQSFLVWQLLLSFIFLGRRYSLNQLFGCFLVAVGVIITVASGSSAGSLVEAGIFWSLLMIVSFLFQAADTVLKEVIFLDAAKRLKVGTVDLFVVNSYGSAYQAVFICLLLPFLSKLWGVPFTQLPNYLRDGAACFLNIGTLSGGCDGAPLLPLLFIIVNMGFNISLLHLLQISSAVVSCLASTVSVPISVFLFTLPLPYLGVASSLPPGFVAGAIILVLGMLIYTWRPLNRLNNQGVDNCHC
ncbi:protein CLT3, chloroplastic isoform X1 [Nicotiana tabacum]|uniref:Protein CLT3, chloroplastic isoform X1 n=2 Tax=Nicotiana tabacum TaxID=4097 RepID=A0A1S4BFI9_TOBAC|nr:protein CLT3, chloroplastic isoform X1 [Nicotiana tomentosiformis]XP_016487593.1 PREDICTED: protein CLT3, chloroplastic-like isoform X2 [Nicotiana tabacum]